MAREEGKVVHALGGGSLAAVGAEQVGAQLHERHRDAQTLLRHQVFVFC